MKKVLLIALAACAGATVATPLLAADGCGPGYHRGPRGHCHPNGGPPVVVAGPRIGVFYANQGYWDGHRYWQHRERWHDGWRYR